MSKITESDLEKVRELVAPVGFEVLNISSDDNTKFIILKKLANPWEDIDESNMPGFVRFTGPMSGPLFKAGGVYRIKKDTSLNLITTDCYDGYRPVSGKFVKTFFQPATEDAFVDHLKVEALDRFPNLKVGDIFKAEWSFEGCDTTCNIIDPSKWTYISGSDRLYLGEDGMGGAPVFCKGKFAERISSSKENELTDNQKEILDALEHFFGSPLKEFSSILSRLK